MNLPGPGLIPGAFPPDDRAGNGGSTMIRKIVIILCGLFSLEAGAAVTAPSPSPWQLDLIRRMDPTGKRKLIPYKEGIYGKIGSGSMFLSTRERVPDQSALYLAIVQVLSEKYACFMRRKVTVADLVSFKCRDSRVVVFKKASKGRYVYFHSWQYDRWGYQLIMEKGKLTGRRAAFFELAPPDHQGRRRLIPPQKSPLSLLPRDMFTPRYFHRPVHRTPTEL